MPLFSPSNPFRLYKDSVLPNKDSRFISGIIKEQINIGGVTVYVWLYEGFFDQTGQSGGTATAVKEDLNDPDVYLPIQDAVLGEIRDRRYADDAVHMVGVYQVSPNTLDYARFGTTMFGQDQVQMDFHKEEMERLCGRRLIPGDVIEMPHLRDVANDGRPQNKWYEINNISRNPTSWDATWQYHVLTVTMKPITDAQEFNDLMERVDEYGKSLRDQVSNRKAMDELTAHNQASGAEQVNTTWWDTTPIYIDPDGQVIAVNPPALAGTALGFVGASLLTSIATWPVSYTYDDSGKTNVWTDDAVPPNGLLATQASSFPSNPSDGQYILRIDFLPNRLYRYQQKRWVLKEIDHKRTWQPYNWVQKLREFMSDRSDVDTARPWQLKSIHDIQTPRSRRSNPSPNTDTGRND